MINILMGEKMFFTLRRQNKKRMYEDKTLFSEKVPAGKRTYFFDLKENQQGSKVLKITESRKNEGDFIRHSVLIFQEDFSKIFDALEKIKAEIGPMERYERKPNEDRNFNTDSDFNY